MALSDNIELILNDNKNSREKFSLIIFKFYNGDRGSLFKNYDGTMNLIKYYHETNVTKYLIRNATSINDIFDLIENEPNLISKVLIYKRYGKTTILELSSSRKKNTNDFIVKETYVT